MIGNAFLSIGAMCVLSSLRGREAAAVYEIDRDGSGLRRLTHGIDGVR